jgi:hypothetical protein
MAIASVQQLPWLTSIGMVLMMSLSLHPAKIVAQGKSTSITVGADNNCLALPLAF